MKHLLYGSAVVLGLAQHAWADGDYENSHLIVSATELELLVDGERAADENDLVLIDVRPEAEFAAGHIPGAINIPFTELTDPSAPIEGILKPQDDLAALLGRAGIDAASDVVLYDDRGGFRAASLFWLLETYGHRNVAILDGGIGTWTASGRDLSTEASDWPKQASTFTVAYTPRRDASADWILEHRDAARTVVVDVRPEKLFAEGHIPWAKNLPWSANLDTDGTMLEAESLATRFTSAGVDPEDNVVIHCQTGEASAHSYFALRLLGYPRVRVYHRSWAEWGMAGDLPVATRTDDS
ncbi:MAG: sulfurtransferase [Pseudomonadota bacterium]